MSATPVRPEAVSRPSRTFVIALGLVALVTPLALALIFVLLFWTFQSTKNASLIVMNVPFAMIGGLVALLLTRIHLSISAAVGFIALFGIAVQNGVILVSEINRLRESGQGSEEAVLNGAASRLRPVIMTALSMGGMTPR